MEYCSHELSVQLRDAGFPQPSECVNGQAWYNPESPGLSEFPHFLSVLKNISDPEKGRLVHSTMIEMIVEPRQFWYEADIVSNWVYAPTVLDIMKHLPGWYALHKIAVQDGDNQEVWGCEEMAEKIVVSEFYLSALEAAAKRWMSLVSEREIKK